jgi:hypothetical protein
VNYVTNAMTNHNLVFCSLNTGRVFYSAEVARQDDNVLTEVFVQRDGNDPRSGWRIVDADIVVDVVEYVEHVLVKHEHHYDHGCDCDACRNNMPRYCTCKACFYAKHNEVTS